VSPLFGKKKKKEQPAKGKRGGPPLEIPATIIASSAPEARVPGMDDGSAALDLLTGTAPMVPTTPAAPARRGAAAATPSALPVVRAADVGLVPAPGEAAQPERFLVPVPEVIESAQRHFWRPLRPAGLSPFYGAIDNERLNEAIEAASRRRDDIGGTIDRITPASVVEDRTHYAIGGSLYSTIVVKDWPQPDRPADGPAFWFKLMDPSAGLPEWTVALHHWRKGTTTAERRLIREIDKRKVRLSEMRAGGAAESALAPIEREIEEIEAQRRVVARGIDTQFDVSAYLRINGRYEEELRTRARSAIELFRSESRTALLELPGEQRDGYLGSMPFGLDPLYLARMQGSERVAEHFPFITRGHVDRDGAGRPYGVLYGVHAFNRTPIVMSPFNADDTIEIQGIIGMPGSGKTFWLRSHLSRMAATGTRILVIDPIGDYVLWARNNDGQVVEISATSESHVNPLARAFDQKIGGYEDIPTKIDQLKPLFRLLLSTSYSNERLRVITAALSRFYESFDPAIEELVMRDFLRVLRDMTELGGESIGSAIAAERDYLYDLLRATTLDGDLAPYFAHKTNVDLSSPRIVFDIHKATETRSEHLKFAAFMAVTLAVRAAKSSMHRKIIAIDEVHLFLAAGEAMEREAFGDIIGNTLAQLVREHRHYATGLTIATQFFDDERQNEAQRSILTSVRLWVLLAGTDSMLRSAAGIVDGADLEFMRGFISKGEASTTRKRARPAIIYRWGRPFPVFTIATPSELHDDDPNSGVRR
jgi:hypothetical protein